MTTSLLTILCEYGVDADALVQAIGRRAASGNSP